MKGGGKRKVYYTALCLNREHGERGQKSSSTHWFIKVSAPKSKKISHHTGCPHCKNNVVYIY